MVFLLRSLRNQTEVRVYVLALDFVFFETSTDELHVVVQYVVSAIFLVVLLSCFFVILLYDSLFWK